jgi:hypothetical protein
LEEAGWTQETPLRFTHPDGRVIERDSGSSGRKAGWYSTDASGNQAYHEDLRGAILAATEGRTAAPAAPTTPTPAPAAKAGNAETGAKTVRQRLAEKGWNQDDTFSMTHPDGSSITRERVGLWAYVDAAGNRTTYESQGEAISAALGDKPIESLEADKLETPVDRQVAAFVAQMNPMQKGRAIAALRKNVRVNSRIVSRQDLVYERVMAGDYTVIAHPADKRRLWKEDGFTTENDISKTAMDFAEFLLKEKGYVREGDRYVPPSKPKTTPAPPTPPPAPTPAGEAVTPDTMRKAGIDVSFLESLASKYGAPPAPVTEAAGIYGPLGRAANMLERAAGKSKSSEELAEILRHAQRSKAHRAVFAVARNPNTDEQTFEKAIKDKEANKYVSPSYWEGLRTERAERAKTSKTVAPTKRKAAPVKKEPTPKPAPKPAVPTGQPINEKTLTDRGWTKQKPDAYSGPNGEKLERDADRRGEPWVYTDRAGNTQGFSSAREAIKAIISEPEAAPTPPAPVKAKPAAKKAKPATPPAAEPTPTEPAAAKGVETAPAEVKEIFREIDAGKNKRTVRRRVQDDYKDGKKALFVADNIEQIIAEAEATGKVTKVCP